MAAGARAGDDVTHWGNGGPQPVLTPPPPRVLELSGWWLRVLASVLDSILLAAVSYLAFPVQAAYQPAPPGDLPLSLPLVAVPEGATWPDTAWLLGAAAVFYLMQAYLGSTPGKLVMGIAVVRLADCRPAGTLRTVGRALAHVLDGIFMIGYLRPLWNVRHQTFADSIAGTVVVATRRPLPYVLQPDRVFAHSAERDRMPASRRVLTAVAVVACLVAVPLGASSIGSGSMAERCTVPSVAGSAFALVGGSVDRHAGTILENRLGIERRRIDGPAGVRVTWDWEGTTPADDVILRVTVQPAGGAPFDLSTVMRGGQVLPAQGLTPLDDGTAAVLVEPAMLASAGDDWTWSLSLTAAGVASPACSPQPVP